MSSTSSTVCDYFHQVADSADVICNICQAELPYSQMEMMDHLKYRHKGVTLISADVHPANKSSSSTANPQGYYRQQQQINGEESQEHLQGLEGLDGSNYQNPGDGQVEDGKPVDVTDIKGSTEKVTVRVLQQNGENVEELEIQDVKPTAKSQIWKYYRSIVGQARVMCLLCKASLSHKYYSTKGMWNHLSLHPEALQDLGRTPGERRPPRFTSGEGSSKKRKRALNSASADLYLDAVGQQDSGMAGPPVVKMSRTETFSAAHHLINPFMSEESNLELYGKCSNPNGHGHNYRWTVVLKGPVDETTGMVYNLADLKREMAEVLETVDHKHIDKDVPHFRFIEPKLCVHAAWNLGTDLYYAPAEKCAKNGYMDLVVMLLAVFMAVHLLLIIAHGIVNVGRKVGQYRNRRVRRARMMEPLIRGNNNIEPAQLNLP